MLQVRNGGNGKSTSPLRVLLYSRVSSLQQARYGHSIEAQPEALHTYAKAQGWEVIGHLTDPGRTGRDTDRKGFTDLLEAVRSHRPDAVLVTRLSRFMRNARLTLNAVHDMRELGVGLVCKDEPIDTRQHGISDMFLAILATMAEWESDRLSEYSKESRQRSIAQGRWPAGKAPFGYRYDKDSRQLVLIPEQAEVVRLIFSLYVDERLGMSRIRAALKERGIKSPHGSQLWGVNVIKVVLSNRVYTGLHSLGIPAPEIVSQPIFDRAQYLRSANAGFHPPRKDPWPLQNRLLCRLCGSHFRCFYTHDVRFYRCKGRETGSRHFLLTGSKCPAPGLRAETVEMSIYSALMGALTDPTAFLHLIDASIVRLRFEVADLERDAGPLEEGRRSASEELTRIERAWIRGVLSESELTMQEANAKERLEYYGSRLDMLDRGHLADLERTRNLLSLAEEAAAEAKGTPTRSRLRDWLDVILGPHLPDEGFNKDWDLVVDDPAKVPGAVSEILNRLQAECFYTGDGLDIKGVISLGVPLEKPEGQASSSPCG